MEVPSKTESSQKKKARRKKKEEKRKKKKERRKKTPSSHVSFRHPVNEDGGPQNSGRTRFFAQAHQAITKVSARSMDARITRGITQGDHPCII
jgi:hypothetical protein